MKTYTVDCSWEMYGHIEIEANIMKEEVFQKSRTFKKGQEDTVLLHKAEAIYKYMISKKISILD